MSKVSAENLTYTQPTRIGSAIVIVLCALAILSVIAYGAVDTWGIAMMAFGAMLIVWLWAADAWKLGAFTFNANLIQLSLVGLILIGLIQLLPVSGRDLSSVISIPVSQTLSVDANSTRFAVIKLFIYLVFFAAALNFLNTSRRYRRLTFAVITFGALIAAFAIFQKLVNPDKIYGARETVQASIFGPFVNGHHFAALMEMTLGLSLGLMYGRSVRKELRVIFLLAAVLMGVAIIMTGSRGGLLSFIGVLGFVTVLSLTKKGKGETEDAGGQTKFLLIGGGMAFLLLMAGVGLMLSGDSAMRGIGLGDVGTDLSTGRFHYWHVAFEVFKHDPLLGAGLDAFGVAFTQHDTWNGVFRLENAHNDYLQVLAEAGVPGFICIVGFIFLLFKQGLENIRSTTDKFYRSAATGALAGCFGVMIHSFFDFPLRTPANVLVFLLMASLVLVSVKHSRH